MSHLIFVPATAAPDAGADIARQTAVTLERVDARLRADRSSLADAAVVNVYLRRASDFPAMNEAYRQAWKAAPPTRTTVVVDPQTAGADVEMSAVAVPAGADPPGVPPPPWVGAPQPDFLRLPPRPAPVFSGAVSPQRQGNNGGPGGRAPPT